MENTEKNSEIYFRVYYVCKWIGVLIYRAEMAYFFKKINFSYFSLTINDCLYLYCEFSDSRNLVE